jgi:hypothetical protein
MILPTPRLQGQWEDERMARRGDGIYLRRRARWLDFMHDGRRHVARLGKNISRTVAGELARVERTKVLKGEAGIGGKRADVSFDQAKAAFLEWAEAKKRARTVRTYPSASRPWPGPSPASA